MKNWKTLLLGIAMIANTSFAAPQVVDKVAAVVNNGVVLESDVDGLMQSVKLNAAQARQQLPDDATLRHQIMERLIMDQIILQMGQKMGVKISDEQLDQAIANIAKQNNMTLDQMRSRLAYDGLNYNTYRNQIRKEMIISEVRNNEVRRRITILPQEVESLAQQVGNQNDASTELNLSHILIPLPENPTSDQVNEAESQARAIVDQARNGADFGKLAIAHSADQQALNGGQMGWGRIQELPGIFAQALSTAKKGDIVGPIRSGVGFHILKVNDLRGESKNISVTEVHARHILLKPSPIMTDEQARVKLEQIAADIKSGKTTFAAAAKEFSQDPGSANQGGDLGWATPDIFDPAFRDALTRLNKGQMSAPVHSSFGWHLIELLDTRNVDKTQRVVITPGEPAGIGPDLVVQLAQREWPVELVVCADATLLTNRAAMLGLPLTLRPYSPNSPAQPQTAGTLTLLPVALRAPVTAGQLAVENGHYVVETLARACDGCLNGEFAALITGPVHKGVINDAGIPFTGHTEFFEERSQAKKVVMMLATEELRVALATTHLPLRDIADAITPALLHEVIAILHHDLRTKFGIAEPRILVCGLNPHAGEGGHMGTEEIDTIIPVLNELRAQGMKLNGPLPADTLFQPKYLDNADAVLAMYHDQGLPVLKYQGFGRGVNITLGLPFIRTSVDHGTALELAGRGKADVGSFITALNLAIKMIVNTQ